MGVYLGIDIGGTSIRVVKYDEDGHELGRSKAETDGDNYFLSLGRLIVAAGTLLGKSRPRSIGAGVAGPVNSGIITGSGNLPDWIGHNLAEDLNTAFGARVAVINDCEAATLGEATSRTENFAYMIWGTGVGASVCKYVHGQPDVDSTELGHMIIFVDGQLVCGCGGIGHLEAHVGGGNILKRFGVDASQLSDNQWSTLLKEMAAGIHNISARHSSMPVVLGGGVAIKQLGEQQRLPELQGYVNSLANRTVPPVKLSLAKYGEDSGLRGALYAALQLVA